MSIKANKVTKIYGTQKALDDVTFEIQSQSITGFLGPNGAGKTTMMKILTGFIPPSSGEAFVNDVNVMEDTIRVRKDIGYLPETNPLYPDMFVEEYLEFVAGIYKLGKGSKARIKEMIEQTGLTPEKHKKVGELSKGYRQRVGLAQTLMHDPKVLILDEPTSGLDPNQIVEIRSLIKELGRQKTVMLSTHIMQEVEAICDRVIIINDGRIVADDAAGKIRASSKEQKQTIIVEFNTPVQEEDLARINKVKKAVPVKDNTWLLESSVQEDIRPAVFQFAVDNGLTVLSLQQKEKRLEEIFQELTK